MSGHYNQQDYRANGSNSIQLKRVIVGSAARMEKTQLLTSSLELGSEWISDVLMIESQGSRMVFYGRNQLRERSLRFYAIISSSSCRKMIEFKYK